MNPKPQAYQVIEKVSDAGSSFFIWKPINGSHQQPLKFLDHADSTSIESMLIQAKVQWIGHLISILRYRIHRHLLYVELQCDKRHQGQPNAEQTQSKLTSTSTKKGARESWCLPIAFACHCPPSISNLRRSSESKTQYSKNATLLSDHNQQFPVWPLL